MYPHDLHLAGWSISIWNATFLLAVVVGYPLLRATMKMCRVAPLPRLLLLRWMFTVYVCVLGAQLFAYAFDLHTSFLPPPTVGWARYYLDPLFGPKTLYGAIVMLPLSALAVSIPWGDLRYGRALDCWTPTLFAVLGISRLGCFLQGCCYGVRSHWFGMPFPPEAPAYYAQLREQLIDAGSWTLPVVPTQLIEATALFAFAAASWVALRRGATTIFPAGVAAYSALRFVLEFVRADPDRNVWGPLSTSQWIALIILAGYVLWRSWRR